MLADLLQTCLITVDGTDFLIPEPDPFDPDYYSHKLEHAGLRYEIGVCIKTGWIVWINGPFPCGAWPDLRIARSALHYMLLADEFYVADGGYQDGGEHSVTPNGMNDYEQRTYALARARHETINRVFKTYECFRTMFRHQREKHGLFFRSAAVIIQLGLREGSHTFTVHYDEAEFGNFEEDY